MSRYEEMEYLRSCLEPLLMEEADGLLADPYIESFFLQRIRSPGLRSYIGYKVHQMVAPDKRVEDAYPLLAAVEASIISTYSFNQVLDSKGSGSTLGALRRMTIGGNIAKDMMNRLILNAYEPPYAISLLAMLNRVHTLFYQGQLLNNVIWVWGGDGVAQSQQLIEERLWEDFRKAASETVALRWAGILEAEDLRRHYARLFLINGHFFGEICRVVAQTWGNLTERAEDVLFRWGCSVGVAEHVVNDVMDFTLPSMETESAFKCVDDLFSDLKCGVETLPIFLGRRSNVAPNLEASRERAAAGCATLSFESMASILAELCDTGILRGCLELAATVLGDAFRMLRCEFREINRELGDIENIPFRNKYVYNISQWWRSETGRRF